MVFIGEIDKEIARLTARLVDLKTRRNLLVPVGGLPEELLGVVFNIYFHRIAGQYPLQSQSQYLRNLRPIMHTCSVWRTAAQRCRILWSVVHQDYHPHSTDWILKHSQNVPLRVFGTFPNQEMSPELLNAASRIVEMGCHYGPLELNHPSFEHLLDAIVRGPPGPLRVLAIRGDGEILQDDATSSNLVSLLHSTAQTLQKLHLESPRMSWTLAPRFTNLESLAVFPLRMESNLVLHGALSKLAISCPALHTLAISDGVDSDEPFPAAIRFPSLKRFACDFPPRRTRRLAQSVSLPPDCHSRVFTHSLNPVFITSEYFESALANVQPALGGRPFGLPQAEGSARSTFRFAYLSMDETDVKFSAYEVKPPFTSQTAVQPSFPEIERGMDWPWVHVSLSIPNDDTYLEDGPLTLSDILRAVAMHDVEELSIWVSQSRRDCIEAATLEHSLRAFGSLHTLRVSDCFSRDVLEKETVEAVFNALNPPALDDGTVSPLPVPKLRYLEIGDIDAASGLYPDDDDEPSLLWNSQQLVNVRRERGAPLERLRLYMEDFTAFDVHADGHVEYF